MPEKAPAGPGPAASGTAPSPPPAEEKGKRPRATQAEKNYRLHTLLELSNRGFSPRDLQRYAVENFGVSPSRAWSLVDETYSIILSSYSRLDLKRLGATLLGRYDFIYRKAVVANDLRTMLSATDSVARVYLATAKEFEQASPPPPAAGAALVEDPEEQF